MLSIGAMGPGQSGYYLTLAREDYYIEGGEPEGVWHGGGAKALGLEGTVAKQTLRNLFKGLRPEGDKPLVQLQRGRRHQPGWDLTFSAPKSVSVLWSQADPSTRHALQAAHLRAVQTALTYIEENAAFTRRGRGGANRELCRLVVAMFEHGTSRAQDPQLHTHCLVMNIAARDDGTFGTISSLDLYLHKMVAGVLYRTQLAHECARLGLELTRGEHSFELAAIPKELNEHFSTRRHEILDIIAREGFSGPTASDLAALSTREVKGHIARQELFSNWQHVGRDHQFSRPEASLLVAPQEVDGVPPSTINLQAGNAVKELSNRHSHFSEADLIRRVAHALEHRGIAAADLLSSVRQFMKDSENLEVVREANGYTHYAPRDVVAAEKSLLENARKSQADRSHIVSEKVLERVRRSRTLTPEQDAALRHITAEPGSIKCVEGMAGTGKTYLLAAAREAWESQGFRVIGCTLAARAARQLERDSGIKSDTLAKTLLQLSPDSLTAKVRNIGKGLLREAKLGFQMEVKGFNRRGKQKVRAAFRRHEQKRQPFALDKKTVVVLDEAGMVGSMQMSKLIEHATKAGAKLVTTGENRQIQPIEAGAPFRALAATVGSAQLTEIIRQRHQWMREAVSHFADGDARSGLSLYAKAGKVHVTETRDAAMTRLAAAWNRSRTPDLSQTLILAGTRAEVTELNLMAQELRRLAGELGKRSITVGGQQFFEGDRITFTKNSRTLGLANGDFGTVENIRGIFSSSITPITIRLDRLDQEGNPIRVTFTPGQCSDIQLGYAVTTHKAQGATVDRTFILAGGWMQDRELSYVQMSRHRDDARIFVSWADAGEDLVELTRCMERSRAKEMAIETAELRRENEALS